ncbi:Annexin [Ascobolus immersus RN42]|uniref:Annexin n=1 Tax=Ascobolus immersus RN42 TaxID=1160509 RepID=A0A3N4IQZ6_ASCIM|nr:Annexin [Ascobolus immersus RN42]
MEKQTPVEMPAAAPPAGHPPHPQPQPPQAGTPPPGGHPVPQQAYGQYPYPAYSYPHGYPAPPPAPGAEPGQAAPTAPADGSLTPTDRAAPPPPAFGYPPQQYAYLPPPQGYPAYAPQPGTSPSGTPAPPAGYPGYPPPPPPHGYPAYAAHPTSAPPPPSSGPSAQPDSGPTAGAPPPGHAPYPPTQPGYPPPAPAPAHYAYQYALRPAAAPVQHHQYPQTSAPAPTPQAATTATTSAGPPAPKAPALITGAVNPRYKDDIATIFKATKGFGCDDKALINVLAARNAATIDAIRNEYISVSSSGKDLITTIEKEVSGTFQNALKALAYGPIQSEAFWAKMATDGLGTNEKLLTESLLGKEPHVLAAIKEHYSKMFGSSLESDVKKDLSGNTKEFFKLIFEAADKPYSRPQTREELDHELIKKDCKLIRNATSSRLGTDDIQVQMIFTRASAAHLNALVSRYYAEYKESLRETIKKEFSGHQLINFLWILDGITDKASRDATALEESMPAGLGLGTNKVLLVSRLIRIYWEGDMEVVKKKYENLFGKDLGARIRGKTSGSLQKLCVKLVEGDGRGL